MRFIILLLAFIIPSEIQNASVFFQKEQLIVFIQDSDSKVGSTFNKEILPQIESLSKEQGVEYILEAIGADAPKEVTYTPFVAFRDNRGVSYFSGRWNQISKIKNFIRSTRVLHQMKESNIKDEILVWETGRMNVIAPLKVTELKGKLPKKFDAEFFQKEALASIEEGSSNFNIQSGIDATLSTRSFYWAMYPYRDESGRYNITGEIYSQYNCVDPIYTHFENPVVNKDCKKAFKEMTSILEVETLRQMNNPEKGDGFDVVSNDVKEVSWNKFGNIEAKNEGEEEVDWSKFKLKKEWKVKGVFAENVPLIYFKFMQPLDGYTGEVKELNGELSLLNDTSIKGAKGEFRIPIKAITMGDPGLDDAIHSFILDGEKYPEASFVFEKMEWISGDLEGGSQSEFTTNGIMEMKGKSTRVLAKGLIKPYLMNEQSLLNVNLKFSIDKSEFGVESGPDGPDEIKEEMEFYMNFLME